MAESSHSNSPRRSGRLTGCFARLVAAVILAVSALSCDTPGIRLVNPDIPADSSTGVTFRVTLEDSALAESLGWEAGVPNALISYYRIMEGTPIQTAETDSAGSLRHPNLLSGRYRFAAYRLLSQEETGVTDGQIRAFGTGLIVHVQPPQVVELALRADRRGSVLISEVRRFGKYEGPESDWPEYDYFDYFELYNNSDTTVYLDGMLWGWTFPYVIETLSTSCAVSEPYRNDPLGVWTRFFHQFPGSGSDYPLAPGQTAVVAMDAVDHSLVHPSLPDLSHADFELEGTADADNPDVPNMPDVGPSPAWHSHGLEMHCRRGCMLVQATDVDTLVHERLPFSDRDWVRIPMESILDVVTTDSWTPSMDQFTPCATMVHPNLDRLEKPDGEALLDVSIAMHRRILGIGTGGFPLLQDVGVSFSDFVFAERSPGWIDP